MEIKEDYREKYEELRNKYEIIEKVNGELVKENERLKDELKHKRTEDSGKS